MKRAVLAGLLSLALVTPAGAAAPAIPPGAPATSIGIAKFGAFHARIPFLGGNSSSAGAGTALMGVWTAEAPYYAVQLIYYNYTTTAFTVTAAAVAPSASLNDNVNALKGDGTVQPWTVATFNNGGAASDTPSPSGSTRTVTVPAGTQNSLGSVPAADVVPGVAYGDIIPITSLPRTDGGSLPLLMTRTYSAAAQPCYYGPPLTAPSSPTGGSAWDAYTAGRIVRASNTSADVATSPGVVSGGVGSLGYLNPIGVRFLYGTRGLSVLYIGDSQAQGLGTVSREVDPVQLATEQLSTPAFPITYAKGGYSGMSSLSFQNSGYAWIAGLKPDVVFIKTMSPNDFISGLNLTTTTITASVQRAFQLANWLLNQGIVPVLVTEMPWGNTTTAQDTARLAGNALLKASGFMVADLDAVTTDGATPARLKAGYAATGGQAPHWNDAAAAAMTPVITAIMQKVIAQRPR